MALQTCTYDQRLDLPYKPKIGEVCLLTANSVKAYQIWLIGKPQVTPKCSHSNNAATGPHGLAFAPRMNVAFGLETCVMSLDDVRRKMIAFRMTFPENLRLSQQAEHHTIFDAISEIVPIKSIRRNE